MQIRISYRSNKNIILPTHYNNIIQAFIYNNIDEKLASFLHDKGYASNGRIFKLFTFSRILNKGKNEKGNLIFGKEIKLIVSSPLDSFCKSIANNMLQKENLYLGQNKIRTEQIEILNHTIDNNEIMVNALSPIVVYSTFLKQDGSKYTCYFMPKEPDFNKIITENLIKKYNALNDTNVSFEKGVELIPFGQPKKNITYYKNTIIIGSTGKFLIKGNKELLQIGLDAGFGSKNSQGFGCVKIIK